MLKAQMACERWRPFAAQLRLMQRAESRFRTSERRVRHRRPYKRRSFARRWHGDEEEENDPDEEPDSPPPVAWGGGPHERPRAPPSPKSPTSPGHRRLRLPPAAGRNNGSGGGDVQREKLPRRKATLEAWQPVRLYRGT